VEDPIEHQSWDSEHFGLPIARVGEPDSAARLEQAVGLADEAGVRCLTALIDSGNTEAILASESLGFRCYDVRIELDREVPGELEDVGGIRLASEADVQALEPLAGRAFLESRFYADPHFPEDSVRELYVAWLRRGSEAEDRLVLTTDGRDGFVVCHLDAEARLGTIELIAVDTRSEGVGYGGKLLRAAEKAFVDAGLDQARVVTQGRNISAQRLYQRHGYRTRGLALWLHRWALST
jgi:ribosomal protein S18 acetylase RimI-like enzyme